MQTVEKLFRVGILVAIVALLVIEAPVIGLAIGRGVRRLFRRGRPN